MWNRVSLAPPALLAGVFTLTFAVGPTASLQAADKAVEKVDFNRDIRPIFAETCYTCHGPDSGARVNDLRFDVPEIALAPLKSGKTAVVPGHPEKSEMVQRVTTDDIFTKMPPFDSGMKLTPEQINLIVRWVKQGAHFEKHWAFVPPVRPELPKTAGEPWVDNQIDAFVLRKLREKGLEPNGYADPGRMLRRLSLDLTGLPPTIDELDAFRAADPDTRYAAAVDRLLASPHYGEHQGRYWLDAARFGETSGLHRDIKRRIYPYRTWVIRAFNQNKPFDEFTVEQLAGDLLPNPTTSQLVATGFNRCNVTSDEGGSIKEELRVRYMIDRTKTMGTVFLGLTIGCAVCHDHKFDPISQEEFYSMAAYYNNAADPAMAGATLTAPTIKVPTDQQQARMADLETAIAQETASWSEFVAALSYPEPNKVKPVEPLSQREEFVWVDDEIPEGSVPTAQGDRYAEGWRWVSAPKHPVHSGERASYRQAQGTSVAQHFFLEADPLTIGKGDTFFAYVYIDPNRPPKAVMLQYNKDGSWNHRAIWGQNTAIPFGKVDTPGHVHQGPLPESDRWVRLEVSAQAMGLKPGDQINGMAFTQAGGDVYWDTAGIVTASAARLTAAEALASWETGIGDSLDVLPEAIREIVAVKEKDRDAAQKTTLLGYFRAAIESQIATRRTSHEKRLANLQGQMKEVKADVPGTMIYGNRDKQRQAYVLKRGQYDDHGKPVEPSVLECLHPMPEDAPQNRLGLAHWLVDEDNPLIARVTVNRIWQHYFGTGLVKTANNFGIQGKRPSHPELLDWLAVEFMESGWDVKHIHRLIVTSHTYRQSSLMTPQEVGSDPNNRYFSHGPRFRLSGEVIRDMTLAASGLFVEEIGGASVNPYQPDGIWEAVTYSGSNTSHYHQDHGGKLYRRSIYTFWKRTAPSPMLTNFDAPTRSSCVVNRGRTNTPLQALTLMNSIQFIEAARNLAARALREREDFQSRVTFCYRLLMARPPRPEELALLRDTFEIHLADYRVHPDEARKLLDVGESPRDDSLELARHAAWTMIAHLLLNMDETITKN